MTQGEGAACRPGGSATLNHHRDSSLGLPASLRMTLRGGLRGCMSHAIRVILSSPIFGERRIPEAQRAKTSFGSEWPTTSTEHLLPRETGVTLQQQGGDETGRTGGMPTRRERYI